MIYNRAMEFHWDDEQKVGILLWKGRAFKIEGYIDPFNARRRAEAMAAQRGWKKPPDKIHKKVSRQTG
ncbi:hypothetical protein [Neorhizobium galegae]|uniref:hypothetical protein n=1 Tax=Neorhizobium galegae TaxID=399 RepID=UPI001F4773D4|nr:hypothetical protein [Neorhizobium galegae]UIK06550.1 hypothetical protein LZK81_06100 [Neorhizobium galegae]